MHYLLLQLLLWLLIIVIGSIPHGTCSLFAHVEEYAAIAIMKALLLVLVLALVIVVLLDQQEIIIGGATRLISISIDLVC